MQKFANYSQQLLHVCLPLMLGDIVYTIIFSLKHNLLLFSKASLDNLCAPLVKRMTMKFSMNRNERDLVSLEHQLKLWKKNKIIDGTFLAIQQLS